MRPPREDTKPWYRQFWPWFLIALPGSVVIASMVTIWLAASTSDSLVRDDYYKEGLAINQEKAREHVAEQLGIRCMLEYDAATGRLVARINEAPVGELSGLNLSLFHPTLSQQDVELALTPVGERVFEGHVKLAAGGVAWHVVVTPPGETWRLQGRWNPVTRPQFTLPAPPAGTGSG